VDVQHLVTVPPVEEVLAVRLDAVEPATVEPGRARLEPTLGR
jgi:hypothetical protein